MVDIGTLRTSGDKHGGQGNIAHVWRQAWWTVGHCTLVRYDAMFGDKHGGQWSIAHVRGMMSCLETSMVDMETLRTSVV